ncbi:MAG: hypothetical protein HY000_16040 [Planctomycetes bacterium]|nr:hypothetical protein [Planctomycetota bacterium]
MAKPYDSRLIAVVAQEQFEVEFNRFCKLVPIVYTDGVRPARGDFPNDDEVWWMLSAQTAPLAKPGLLVSCHVEDAREYNEYEPTKSQYQAQRESVRCLHAREDGLEVLTIPSDALDNIQDVVSSGYRLESDHQPSPTVLLRWRLDVYGPFTTMIDLASPSGRIRATFSPVNTDMTVYQIASDAFQDAAGQARVITSTDVSPSQFRRSECFNLLTIKHELALASGFERVLAKNPKKLILEPIDRKLVRFAKQCLTRSKRQELRTLLDELEVTGREALEAEELIEAIGRIRAVNEKQDAALASVSKALLDSGVLGEDRLRKAEQEYAQKYVQERTAELQAKIELSISTNRENARQIEARLKDLQAKLQKEEIEGRTELRARLAAEAEKAHNEIEAERTRLNRDKAEFQQQEMALKQNIEKVTREWREAGEDVVNRFLAIAPLLGSTVFAAPSQSSREAEQTDKSIKPPAAQLTFPSYLTATTSTSDDGLTEEEFFDRFRRVVEDNGFTYRSFDLQRFHISVKCGDLTVLGGPSGTGKSSLPALYAEALFGDNVDEGRTCCLMVNVNPSWMDVRDLLGNMNTLERRYYPAESGLFQHLVYAQEEYGRRIGSTGLYMTCLDEMNLSQVEHYFSDFMMVLERRSEQRAIQCFSAETAAEHCPFRKWARITLAPSLRFVGTVNFDETTRLLSDRLLDRVNLIRLASKSLPSAAAAEGRLLAHSEGRMITLADFQAWQNDSALPSELASLLDTLRPLLSVMGCPLSPRVYRAICRFVSSAVGIMSSDAAFDAQLAQRVIPKIRNLVTRSQLDSRPSNRPSFESKDYYGQLRSAPPRAL